MLFMQKVAQSIHNFGMLVVFHIPLFSQVEYFPLLLLPSHQKDSALLLKTEHLLK
jgi:hypothetical protein